MKQHELTRKEWWERKQAAKRRHQAKKLMEYAEYLRNTGGSRWQIAQAEEQSRHLLAS